MTLFVLHSIDSFIATGKLCCCSVCLEENILKTYQRHYWLSCSIGFYRYCLYMQLIIIIFVDGKINDSYQTLIPLKYTWLSFSDSLSIDMGIILDPISVMMLVVVTFVSLMVHIFSLGYMKGEERFGTYYSFLSSIYFSMLGLVIASNIFQIYIFWELVGVSSYLLIGYYYDRPSAVAASKKHSLLPVLPIWVSSLEF